MKARYVTARGEPAGEFELPTVFFDGVVHEPALWQTIKAILANRRQGTHSTKTRGEVSGGNRKPWRQKGTGRARQGSIRAPHWPGGGIVFGPKPRDYHQDVPKKVKALARRSAFNIRAENGEITVIESWELFDTPKTKRMVDLMAKLGLSDRRLLVLTDGIPPQALRLSARNIPDVRVMPFAVASAYDVLKARHLLIEANALRALAPAEVSDGQPV
jgi:large subunit ribosomal protein L4